MRQLEVHELFILFWLDVESRLPNEKLEADRFKKSHELYAGSSVNCRLNELLVMCLCISQKEHSLLKRQVTQLEYSPKAGFQTTFRLTCRKRKETTGTLMPG